MWRTENTTEIQEREEGVEEQVMAEYNLVDVETNKKKVHLVSPCHDYHYLLRLKEAQQLLDQKHE